MDIMLTQAAKAQLHIALVRADKTLQNADSVPDSLRSSVQSLIDDPSFHAKTGNVVRAAVSSDSALTHVAIYCVGDTSVWAQTDWEELGGGLYKAFKNSGNTSLAVFGLNDDVVLRVGRGLKLAAYEYNTYKTKRKAEDAPSLKTVELVSENADSLAADWAVTAATVEGTYLCRDLVNAPPSHLYPETFAKQLEGLAEYGVKVTLISESKLKALGMNSMVGVGQGSVRDSYMVQMEWLGGAQGDDPVMLVGKGVCFDAGGISLKPGLNMQDMRGDMGGAAAVSGAMLAMAKAGVKANVVGLVGLVENMPDGNAIRPGDILHSASGQTIEVQNTDAEGRLVLCDVLWYAQEHFKPKAIVDLATLTGAIVIALGHEYAGLFSTDDSLAQELAAAGEISGEGVWRFPLGKRYDNMLKSKFADMRNIGGRAAGSITAAQFLARFVNDGVRWAHLDIAGVAWVDGEKKATDPSWASGFGPGLLVEWVRANYTNG